jgi:hypothetical protein
MKRVNLLLSGAVVLLAAACGPATAVVTAELEVDNPEGEGTVVRSLAGLEIQLLPFNRDVIFDSLAAAAPTPEPPIPDSLLQAQERVAEAQTEWRNAEAEWQAARDRLQQITDQMEGLSRGEARYVALYREFQDLEGRMNVAERRMNQAFDRFNELQQATIQQAEEIRLRRDNWADETFAGVTELMVVRLRESGREVFIDTTNADGAVSFEVAPGQWWVYARHELPFNELYWNVPVNLPRGEPFQMRLTRENAEVRPNL